VTWWLLIINNKNYFTKINKIKKQLVFPSLLLTIRNLNYNFAWYESISLYNFFKLWRIEIYLSRKFWLITEILTKTEKDCKYNDFNLKLPNSLAYLWLKELNRLDIQITNNIKLAKKYIKLINNKNLSLIFSGKKTEINNYYRIPILLKNKKNREKLYNYMKDNGVLLWKAWTWENIVPIWTQLKKAKYISWSCKIAEDISERILTLPNHRKINQNDVILISKLLNNFKNV
jgi:dTDP-4-amino-4,6-dideoxygalactose transaminase